MPLANRFYGVLPERHCRKNTCAGDTRHNGDYVPQQYGRKIQSDCCNSSVQHPSRNESDADKLPARARTRRSAFLTQAEESSSEIAFELNPGKSCIRSDALAGT